MTGVDLVVVVLASLVGSFVKSVTGMGYPLIAIPVLALFVDVETAVAVVAIPNTVANLLLNVDARAARHETRDLPVLIVTSIVGAVLGTAVLVGAPEEPLVLGLAFTVFAFVVQRTRNPELHLTPATTRRWAPAAGGVAGFFQGAVGVSGPVVAMWFHGYRLGKDAYVFSVTALFLVSGAALLALVATLSMIPVGTRLRDRIGGATFERMILVLLVVSGVSLVARAAA